MLEHRVGPASNFGPFEKRLVAVGDVEVGVFRIGDAFYAWRNVCPHQGGPVCQGRIMKRVLPNVAPDGKVDGRCYDADGLHIVCPWHGAEFDIRTGRHAGTEALRLQSVETVTRDGEVFIRVG